MGDDRAALEVQGIALLAQYGYLGERKYPLLGLLDQLLALLLAGQQEVRVAAQCASLLAGKVQPVARDGRQTEVALLGQVLVIIAEDLAASSQARWTHCTAGRLPIHRLGEELEKLHAELRKRVAIHS